MQTPNTRNKSSEVSQKSSPSTPKASRVKKGGGSETDLSSMTTTPARLSMEIDKVKVDRKSPRNSATEKKCRSKVAELEIKLSHLQEELKKAKDRLSASESSKKKTQQEVEDAKRELLTTTMKLEDSQLQLVEFSKAEEARLQELRRISQDRDRAWQSELEAIQKQHAMDSEALRYAIAEMQRLKTKLDMASRTEPSETTICEIQALKSDISATRLIVESLESQLRSSKGNEAAARKAASEAQIQLQESRSDVEALRIKELKLAESLESMVSELEATKAQVGSLQNGFVVEDPEEMEQLRSALEATEIKNQEEQIQSVMKIQSAQELVVTLESALRSAKIEIFDLKASSIEKEAKIQDNKEGVSESELEELLRKSTVDIAEMKSKLQGVSAEKELLKSEVKLSKEAEKDALARLLNVTDESGESCRKLEKATEQLDAARALNSEMEAELRRLRVQSDQWRKAAEAAAAVLTTGSGRFDERPHPISLESDYNSVAGRFSPFSEDMNGYESPKKKNSNVLKKIGGLWKKGPK